VAEKEQVRELIEKEMLEGKETKGISK